MLLAPTSAWLSGDRATVWRTVAARARIKGGDTIDVTIGDFATANVEGAFSLVYVVANTIMRDLRAKKALARAVLDRKSVV